MSTVSSRTPNQMKESDSMTVAEAGIKLLFGGGSMRNENAIITAACRMKSSNRTATANGLINCWLSAALMNGP